VIKMLDILDNKLGGCLALFILIVISVWYVSPRFFFDENGESKTLYIGNFNINRYGVFVVVVSILSYYCYAMIRYSFS